MGLFRLILLALIVYAIYRVYVYVKQVSARAQVQGNAREQQHATPLTPHEVLGVPPNASQEEIRRAYQKLIQQYHPDRVDGMGAELRELAETRTKEINAAYAKLRRH